jgi:hypothetical protein
MSLDALFQLTDEFCRLAQDANNAMPSAVPTKVEEKPEEKSAEERKKREMREAIKTIKQLADSIERKYTALKTIGFTKQFSTMRDMRKVKSVLEDCNRSLEKLF